LVNTLICGLKKGNFLMGTAIQTYQALLFDLEGTLTDFQWNLKGAAVEILDLLSKHGIDPDTFGEKPDYARLFNTTQKLITTWPQDRAKELTGRLNIIYNRYDADALSRWQLYPDTVSTLKKLFKNGYRMGVVSNCGRIAVDKALKKFNLTSDFDLIISRNEVALVKPHPEGLLTACRILDLPPEDILFVGDSVNDILPANQIGMWSCFPCGGESRLTGVTHHGATHEIATLSDLFQLHHQ